VCLSRTGWSFVTRGARTRWSSVCLEAANNRRATTVGPEGGGHGVLELGNKVLGRAVGNYGTTHSSAYLERRE
jgi:hypothetical protein